MNKLRLGILSLVVCEVLLLNAVVVLPALYHPPYLREAYRAKGEAPSSEARAAVDAALTRKRSETKRLVLAGAGLMAVLAVPLCISIVRAGSLSKALWRTDDQRLKRS